MIVQQHHLNENAVGRAISASVHAAGIVKRVTPHMFRHSFARHRFKEGYGHPNVQHLLDHASVETTTIDTHVLNLGGSGVTSPLDE
jgi:site-specific recombinase XerD